LRWSIVHILRLSPIAPIVAGKVARPRGATRAMCSFQEPPNHSYKVCSVEIARRQPVRAQENGPGSQRRARSEKNGIDDQRGMAATTRW